MAKPIKLKEARTILKESGCVRIRIGSHEMWQRKDGHVFSLPASKPKVSMGIVRKLSYFVSGSDNYGKR